MSCLSEIPLSGDVQFNCFLIHKLHSPLPPQTGSLAGNLCIKKMHPEFPSDVFLLLETVGARLIVAEGVDKMTEVSIAEFMMKEMDMNKKVLVCVCLPTIKSAMNQVVTYKVNNKEISAKALKSFKSSLILFLFPRFTLTHFSPTRSCLEPRTPTHM